MEEAKNIDISFFIPCLNEEDNIGKTIQSVIDVMKNMNMKYEILVVDDNSSDNTIKKVTEEINKNKEVKNLLRERNFIVFGLKIRCMGATKGN